jgi:hypothetical protein
MDKQEEYFVVFRLKPGEKENAYSFVDKNTMTNLIADDVVEAYYETEPLEKGHLHTSQEIKEYMDDFNSGTPAEETK